MAQRLGRPAGALAACTTVGLAVTAVVTALPGRRPTGFAVALALVWSCAPLVVALWPGRRSNSTSPDGAAPAADAPHDAASTAATVTTFVRLGDEPAEIARSSVALARRAGPTVIVARDRQIPDDLALEADAVFVAPDVEAAICTAAQQADTDAVLIVSARAVPDMPACQTAAQQLDGVTGWVLGRSHPFNRDRYASDRREVVGARLRRLAAGRGVDLWENDATLVRTDLLADRPLTPGRTWGAWLRARRAEGLEGGVTDAALSLRAAPVAAGAYWPDAMARQRAAAVDIAGAATTGRWSARLVAAALLARELYAYPLLVWLLMPVLMGDGFAFSVGPWAAVAAVAVSAVLRWWSLRSILGVETVPRADVLGAVYHAPGSLSALGAVLRGRVGTRRRLHHSRPLVWVALALTVVAAYGLFRHEPGRSASRLAVALSLLMLCALWTFTVRSLVERNWSRTAYRVRLGLRASVDGVAATTVDGSPGGVAVRGRFPSAAFPVGAEVRVEVLLDDGSTVAAPGVVAARRRHRGSDLLGLELHPGASALDDWSAQLLRSAQAPDTRSGPTVPLDRSTPRNRVALVLDRLVMTVVVLTSLAVVAALALVLLGYRPLVVRSGSMLPTYQVGDVVLVEQIRADQLRPGEVANLAYYPEFGEGMTHRVRSVRDVDGDVQVETRGDANDSSEVWTVAPDETVGRVVASVPAIGAPATLVRTAGPPLAIGVGVLVLVVAAVLGGHRLRRGGPVRTEDEHPPGATRDEPAKEPATTPRAD